MKICISNLTLPQPKGKPADNPDLGGQVTVKDRFVQSTAGAIICTVPTSLGALTGHIGEALGGPLGRVVGGALGAAAVGAGTYFGLGAVPTEDKDFQRVIQKRSAFQAGLLAAVGAAGGGIAVGLAGAAGAAFSGRVLDRVESMFSYAPQPGSKRTPSWAEERFLTSSDGKRIQAWFTPEPKEGPVCIFFHSNATSLEDNIGRIDTLRQAGMRVLAVESRGFGKSEGIPCERSLHQDALAAYDEALKETTADKILVMGQSIGGGVAAGLASARPCGGLILESAFTSLSDMARTDMGEWGAMLCKGRFPNAERVRDLQVPVFVAHGGWDSMCPVEMGQTLAARSPQATYLEVPQASHMNVYQAPEFAEQLKGFVGALGR